MLTKRKNSSAIMVIIAFATVYLVWGSTYFFIQKAVQHLPALFLGFMRFTTAGILLLTWCVVRKEKVLNPQLIKHAAVSGLLMLFLGNGAVIWAEQSLPSSLVAVLVSGAPLWFVLLDKPKWKINFRSRATIIGLVVGFGGVVMLFSESVTKAFSSDNAWQFAGLIILMIGSASWSAGSLYAKYNSTGSTSVNTAWQMIAAGLAFLPGSLINHELKGFQWETVPAASWLSLIYLIIFGSLAAYSAYVWLLQVRPATQVSTYAYVNPVVAVLLGVFLAGEKMSSIQIGGLAIVLISVLLINLAKYQHERSTTKPVVRKMVIPGLEQQAVCNG
jgi:drug/metabolite transporter (DMT)-like permease